MRPTLRPPWLRHSALLPWHPRTAPQTYVPRRIATTSTANAAPVDLPKLILSPGSVHHNSLPSFLEYAKRTNLTPEKTYYVGTHYEYMSALALMRLGFSLLRVGRSNDAGIDLIGHWVLAPLRDPLPTIIQCKARRISLNPSHVRELEGSFQGTPADWKKKDVLGLLVTTRKATKGLFEALGQSRLPMGFVLISREGSIQQFVWNRAACERGLEGVGVTVRHTPRVLSDVVEEERPESAANPAKKNKRKIEANNTGTLRDIQLTWMGSPIFPERESLDQETLKLMRDMAASSTTPAPKYIYKKTKDKLKPGRPRVLGKAPSPRGGVVGGKRGRPRGSTTQTQVDAPPEKRDPSVGSTKVRSRTTPAAETSKVLQNEVTTKVERRGRPKGSKNKPKPAIDAG